MSELPKTSGATTSVDNRAEVTHISHNSLISWVKDRECYLPYDKFSWFKHATVGGVFNVQLLGRERVRQDTLDIDLGLSIIASPDGYPLVSKQSNIVCILQRQIILSLQNTFENDTGRLLGFLYFCHFQYTVPVEHLSDEAIGLAGGQTL